MPKFRQTRINETLADITEMERSGALQQGAHPTSDRMVLEVAALSDADKDALNEALKRGDYTNKGPGLAIGARRVMLNELVANEKKERALHRALLMVLVLKSNEPFNVRLQNAQATVVGIRNAFGGIARLTDMRNRLKHEVHNLQAALEMVRASVQEQAFNGWDTTKYRDPLRPGCAIGQRGENGPGTLGCFVVDNVNHNIYILSNLHVLKQAGIGLGDAEIIQPSHLCGGSYTDVVADFTDGDVTLDAAIARVRTGVQVTQEIAGENGFRISGTTKPYKWQLVKKFGCATGYRCGEISRHLPFSLAMPRAGFGIVDNLIEVMRDQNRDGVNLGFQIPGDSGTILCDLRGQVIGLMNMGGGNGQSGLATMIDPILARFNVSILGPGLHAAP